MTRKNGEWVQPGNLQDYQEKKENMMQQINYRWTDGKDEFFQEFYIKTEEYYTRIVGGLENRRGFVPYNLSDLISDVLIVFSGDTAIGCGGLKQYSEEDAEIKRVWVEPEYRRQHLAMEIVKKLEEKAKTFGYKRVVLQTRPIMTDAVGLYTKLGYEQIENYPPYDKLEGAVCFAKALS